MIIIFLDIDGTLNHNYETHFSIDNLQAFCHILDETEAFIVISSSWRCDCLKETKDFMLSQTNDETYEYVSKILKRTIGQTPKACHALEDSILIPGDCRGFEIEYWLRTHRDIEDYIIFDDSIWGIFLSQKEHFYHVNKETGLTMEDSNKIIERIKKWEAD